MHVTLDLHLDITASNIRLVFIYMFYKHADTRKEIDAELGKRGNGYAITPKGSDPLSDSVVRLYAMGYDH